MAALSMRVTQSHPTEARLPLDENDLWIAATALVLNASLVSRDNDFEGTAGLNVVTLRLTLRLSVCPLPHGRGSVRRENGTMRTPVSYMYNVPTEVLS